MNVQTTLKTAICLSALALVLNASLAQALTVDPYYTGSYVANSVGSVPGLPSSYGGLTFLDSDTILIGGGANGPAGRLYTIDVVRDAGNHITGFSGTVSQYGGAGSGIGDYNDGGVVFGPGGVLFMARWSINEIGQVKPGTTADENTISPGPVGAGSSVSAVNFVPAGFGGAGLMKVVTYGAGQWYDAVLTPDGAGTYIIGPYTQVDVDPTVAGDQNVPGGPEGFVYVAAGNPQFAVNSLLISEWGAGNVASYEVDGNGNPLVNTRRTFISGLSGAEGATFDPLTGDFLFSTFGGGNQVVVVQGFNAPEPSSFVLVSMAMASLGIGSRRASRRNR